MIRMVTCLVFHVSSRDVGVHPSRLARAGTGYPVNEGVTLAGEERVVGVIPAVAGVVTARYA